MHRLIENETQGYICISKKVKIYINRSSADKKDIILHMEKREEKFLKWRVNKLIRAFQPKDK
jgi:hypothetical protein